MINYILKKIINILCRDMHSIDKMSLDKEFAAYRFNDASLIEDLLKSRITAQMIKYWDHPNIMDKARGLAYKELLDNHRIAVKILDKEKKRDKQVDLWKTSKVI